MMEMLLTTTKHKPPVKQYSGPGGKVLLKGDDDWGYCGRVDSSLISTYAEMRNMAGFTTGAAVASSYPEVWLKFVKHGKVMYICSRPLWSGLSYAHVYSKGLVYGTDDTGKYPLSPEVNQKRNITVSDGEGEHLFRVRLINFLNGDPYGSPGAFGSPSETASLLGKLSGSFTTDLNFRWDTFSDAELGINQGLFNITITSHDITTQTWMFGGSNYYSLEINNKTLVAARFAWRPVLDLITE